MKDGWATSPQIPGVRIPNGSFMGTAGIALPTHNWKPGHGGKPTW